MDSERVKAGLKGGMVGDARWHLYRQMSAKSVRYCSQNRD